MIAPGTAPFERVTLLDAAMDDLKLVAARSPAVLSEVFRLLKGLDAGTVTPQPLHDFAKTGDLSGCGKLVVALEGQPEYRIVVRGQGRIFTVSKVIAVEDRTQDLPYLPGRPQVGPNRRRRPTLRCGTTCPPDPKDPRSVVDDLVAASSPAIRSGGKSRRHRSSMIANAVVPVSLGRSRLEAPRGGDSPA